MSHDTRVARLTAYIALVAVVCLGVGGFLVTPAVLQTQTATAEVRRAAEVAACRAQLRADIDDASAALEVATAELVASVPPAVLSAAGADPAEIQAALDEHEQLVAEVNRQVERLEAATGEYRAAADQGLDDPDGFVARCR